MTHRQSGFTMIELSIVMVIIALLIVGALTGKSLIRSSELRVLVANVNEYKSAITQFELRYDGLPGDITDAWEYWGTDCATTEAECNGNGNEEVDPEFNGGAIVDSDEPFRAVRQLALAEMITLSVNIDGHWDNNFIEGTETAVGNVPTIAKDMLVYFKCCSDTDYNRANNVDFNNHIAVFTINDDDRYRDGAVSPIDARSIDEKLDDGLPDYGFVNSSGSYDGAYTATSCYTGAGRNSIYATDDDALNDQNGCQMQFAYDWD